MSRHASTDTLASYAEGLLKPRRAAKVASHLAGCAQCSGQIQELHQVSVQLASVQFSQMPADLSARIQVAIASEATARVTTESAGEASRRDLPVRGRPAHGRRAGSRGWRIPGFSSPLVGSLAAVGAAVIVAGGGYEIATNLSSSPAGSTAGSSAEHHVPAASPVTGGANAPATGTVRYGPDITYQHGGRSETIHTVETGTNFQGGATFRAQAVTALSRVRQSNFAYAKNAMTSPFAYSGPNNTADAAQIRGCVSKVAAGRDVLLVDLARFQGQQATIVIVASHGSAPAMAYAAGASCSGSNADILATQNLPRLPA
jgi:anti-sigma factor RsiW